MADFGLSSFGAETVVTAPVSAAGFAPLPAAYINWEPSTVSLDSFLRYSVYRRRLGETDAEAERIATITDRSLATHTDYSIASATSYEYNVTQTIWNGVEEIESEFATWTTAYVEFVSAFLHSHRRPEIYVELPIEAMQDSRELDIAEAQVYRRTVPTSHIGPRDQGVVQVPWRETWYEGSAQWLALRDLIAAQKAGDMLVLRQHRDIRMFGLIHAPGRSHAPVMYNGQFTFRENWFEEAV